MERQPVTPASHKEMIRKYPIAELVEGWYFRLEEVAVGRYMVESSDAYGRTISRQVVGDRDSALAECVAFARQALQSREDITRLNLGLSNRGGCGREIQEVAYSCP